jgi:hypothetical protein
VLQRFEGDTILYDERIPAVGFVRFARPGAICAAPSCGRSPCSVELQWISEEAQNAGPAVLAYQSYCPDHEDHARQRFVRFLRFLLQRRGLEP